MLAVRLATEQGQYDILRKQAQKMVEATVRGQMEETQVVIEGQDNVPDTPSVIMIKHTSTLEAYGHVPFFPRTSWVVKKELVYAPVFGWA